MSDLIRKPLNLFFGPNVLVIPDLPPGETDQGLTIPEESRTEVFPTGVVVQIGEGVEGGLEVGNRVIFDDSRVRGFLLDSRGKSELHYILPMDRIFGVL